MHVTVSRLRNALIGAIALCAGPAQSETLTVSTLEFFRPSTVIVSVRNQILDEFGRRLGSVGLACGGQASATDTAPSVVTSECLSALDDFANGIYDEAAPPLDWRNPPACEGLSNGSGLCQSIVGAIFESIAAAFEGQIAANEAVEAQFRQGRMPLDPANIAPGDSAQSQADAVGTAQGGVGPFAGAGTFRRTLGELGFPEIGDIGQGISIDLDAELATFVSSVIAVNAAQLFDQNTALLTITNLTSQTHLFRLTPIVLTDGADPFGYFNLVIDPFLRNDLRVEVRLAAGNQLVLDIGEALDLITILENAPELNATGLDFSGGFLLECPTCVGLSVLDVSFTQGGVGGVGDPFGVRVVDSFLSAEATDFIRANRDALLRGTLPVPLPATIWPSLLLMLAGSAALRRHALRRAVS